MSDITFLNTPFIIKNKETEFHIMTCKKCGEKIPKSQRANHIKFKHPEIREKKKTWRYFE